MNGTKAEKRKMIEKWRLVKLTWTDIWCKAQWETEKHNINVTRLHMNKKSLTFIEPLKIFKWKIDKSLHFIMENDFKIQLNHCIFSNEKANYTWRLYNILGDNLRFLDAQPCC